MQVLERGVRGGAEVADFLAEAFQQHPVIRSAQLPDAVNRGFAQRDDGAGVGGDFPRGGEDFLDVARHAGVQGADSHIVLHAGIRRQLEGGAINDFGLHQFPAYAAS